MDYNFGDWSINYQSPLANIFNFTSTFSYGTFFNGTRFSYKETTQFSFPPKVIISLLWDYNRIKLPNPYPKADLFLISPKIQVPLNRNLFWSTLIQ
jgi:hypothetical protein|tara:strand:+ start:7197 stop:7484 length:288 start_codon:yes stop_codon:yes gene_type:complete